MGSALCRCLCRCCRKKDPDQISEEDWKAIQVPGKKEEEPKKIEGKTANGEKYGKTEEPKIEGKTAGDGSQGTLRDDHQKFESSPMSKVPILTSPSQQNDDRSIPSKSFAPVRAPTGDEAEDRKSLASPEGGSSSLVPSLVAAHTIGDNNDSVRSISLTSDGKILVSGSRDKVLRLLDMDTLKAVPFPGSHTNSIESVCIGGKEQDVVVSGSKDKTVKVWSARSMSLAFTLEGHKGAVASVCLSPDGLFIASGSDDKTIKIWSSAAFGPCLQSLEKAHKGGITSLCFSTDGQRLISGSQDKNVIVWDVAKWSVAATLKGHEKAIYCVAISGDGGLIASGSLDRTVRIWEGPARGDAGACLHTLQDHTDAVYTVVFSPDSRHLASGSEDCSIRLWQAGPPNLCRASVSAHKAGLSCLRFTPDGASLVSSSNDKKIVVWNVIG